jgi:beta-aspartyl-peptidase (threonine type)
VNGASAILLHAGAGPFGEELREHEGECRDVLARVIEEARRAIEAGAAALEVAVAAVAALEDFELFNAGIGAALCADGSVEMSAAVMRGGDRAAGAVAGIRTLAHPIAGARAVLDAPPVLMFGEAAETFAASSAGVPRLAPETFVTDGQRRRLASGVPDDRGTVGAVCLDRRGGLAAATSTGGISGQWPGRVGDSPLIGAGTWADDRVAVSCTGDGEAFIRAGVGRMVASALERGVSLADATDLALADVGKLGGTGGLIALAADGGSSLPFTTGAMPRARWSSGSAEPEVLIGPE